jgi:NAD(P)-dependent dehydrogenase (short-subunit alcohol dehydrogenase family)
MDLSGKKVLVTGAAKRIGYAIALAFAEEGCDLLLHYHQSEEDVKVLQKKILGLGVNAQLLHGDLANQNGLNDFLATNPAALRSVDILINSASIYLNDDADKATQMHCLHRDTPQALSKAIIHLDKPKLIINITDAMLNKRYPNYTNYFNSKAALAELTQALALSMAPHIRVNSVAPGCILFPPNYSDTDKQAILKKIPLQKKGDTKDIAEACLFLAKAPYITGASLTVDGGRSLQA